MVEGVTQLGQDAVVSRYHHTYPLSCSMDPAQKVGATTEESWIWKCIPTYMYKQTGSRTCTVVYNPNQNSECTCVRRPGPRATPGESRVYM